MKRKGMHDVATAQTLINRSIPASRAQIVAQLARMEHEKARLEREFSMWVGKQEQTQWRLRQVQEDIALLQRALDQPPADGEPRRPEGPSDSGDGREAASWREVPLEY